jgi:hypothetical protein
MHSKKKLFFFFEEPLRSFSSLLPPCLKSHLEETPQKDKRRPKEDKKRGKESRREKKRGRRFQFPSTQIKAP